MITDEGYVDGSWELSISVDDLGIERVLRVHGNWHIGGVMFRLVDGLEYKINWSDHALWWPQENTWLLHTRTTLDQYGIQADAKLRFLRMHSNLRVQMPDLQIRDMNVNFAKSVFSVVLQMCKELRIRHPEELSLMRPIGRDELKKPRISHLKRPDQTTPHAYQNGHTNGNGNGTSSSSPLPDSSSPYADSIYNYETLNYSPKHNSTWMSTLKSISSGITSPETMPRNSGMVSPLTLQRNYSSPTPEPQRNYPRAMSPAETKYLTLPSTLGTPRASPKIATNGTLSNTQSAFPTSLNTLAYEGANDSILANSPHVSTYEAFGARGVIRPKNLIQQARMNGAWLESCKSLMEQCIEPGTDFTVQLRFKYFNFYDLNPKYDAIRINQLYQQARWSLLSEEIECTEEEMMFFGGLQLQAELGQIQAMSDYDYPTYSQYGNNDDGSEYGYETGGMKLRNSAADDEIDAILDQIQLSLEGRLPQDKQIPIEIRHVPTLTSYVKVYRPRRFSLKTFKELWLILRETTLYVYRTHEDASDPDNEPYDVIDMRGCEIQADVNIGSEKYGIRTFVTQGNAMREMWLRLPDQNSYAEWTAALQLASRGKTMASKSLFDKEKQATLSFIQLKTPLSESEAYTLDSLPQIPLSNYIAQRFNKSTKERAITQRILEAQSKVCTMKSLECKLNYIRAWQQLPQHGITYFVVKFAGHKKEELLGIAHNRMMKVSPHSGDIEKTWRFSEMRGWHVNWETKEVVISFAQEKVTIQPISAPCKIVHEMIGGCVFLSMRSADKSQELDEETFYKLTSSA